MLKKATLCILMEIHREYAPESASCKDCGGDEGAMAIAGGVEEGGGGRGVAPALEDTDSYSFAIVLSMVENPPIVVESVGDDVFTIYVSVGFL